MYLETFKRRRPANPAIAAIELLCKIQQHQVVRLDQLAAVSNRGIARAVPLVQQLRKAACHRVND